jgi:hypothetical protein
MWEIRRLRKGKAMQKILDVLFFIPIIMFGILGVFLTTFFVYEILAQDLFGGIFIVWFAISSIYFMFRGK